MRSDRVELRALEPEDADFFVAASLATHAARYNVGFTHPTNRRAALALIDQLDFGPGSRELTFAIETRATDGVESTMIGIAGLASFNWIHQRARALVSIPDPDHQLKGCGTESLLLLMQLAFDELGIQKLTVEFVEYDMRALKVCKRVGFTNEACRREAHLHGGRYHDVVVMGMIEADYRRLHGYERLRLLGYTDQQIKTLGSAIRE